MSNLITLHNGYKELFDIICSKLGPYHATLLYRTCHMLHDTHHNIMKNRTSSANKYFASNGNVHCLNHIGLYRPADTIHSAAINGQLDLLKTYIQKKI